MTEPSPANFVNRIFFGYQNAAVLKAALELDVFTAIGSDTLDVAAIVAKSNASPRGIAALCDSLVVMGFLAKSSAGYALTPDAAVFLDRNSPACIAGIHEFLASPEFVAMTFQDPAGAVRRGGAPGLANISPDNPIWIRFARSMGPFMELDAKLVADHASDPPPHRVLDVAASHGLFGLAFGRRFSDCHITGLDWGAVVAVARENADAAGMGDRYDTIVGSAFEVDWGKGYDVVLLPNFLHHFDRAGCMKILHLARAALAPKGRVAVVEWVPNEDRVSPPVPALFAMTMLLSTPSGTTYTGLELSAMPSRRNSSGPRSSRCCRRRSRWSWRARGKFNGHSTATQMCEVDLSVFLGPAKILDGLTADQANAKPHQLPHSIADIVAHLCFWQEWFNAIEEAKRIAARSDALNDPILPPGRSLPCVS